MADTPAAADPTGAKEVDPELVAAQAALKKSEERYDELRGIYNRTAGAVTTQEQRIRALEGAVANRGNGEGEEGNQPPAKQPAATPPGTAEHARLLRVEEQSGESVFLQRHSSEIGFKEDWAEAQKTYVKNPARVHEVIVYAPESTPEFLVPDYEATYMNSLNKVRVDKYQKSRQEAADAKGGETTTTTAKENDDAALQRARGVISGTTGAQVEPIPKVKPRAEMSPEELLKVPGTPVSPSDPPRGIDGAS